MIKKLTSIILVCVLSLTTGFLSIASAATTDSLTEKEHELFLARQDLSNTAYTNMLWSFADNDVDKLEKVYPDYYAGAYIGDNGNLVILTKGATSEDYAELNSICNYSGITYKTAEHSYNELMAVQELVKSRVKYAGEAKLFDIETFSIKIKDKENKVYIGIADLNDTEWIAFLTDGLDESHYEIYRASRPVETVTMTPGSVVYSGGTGSAAYKASVVYDGETKIGFVTAGHVVGMSDVYESSSIFADKIGNTLFQQNSGAVDAAFVELIAPHTFNNVINGYQITPGVSVIPGAGSEVYIKGNSTGTHLAVVESASVSVGFDSGTFTNMIEVILQDGDYVEHGDSGGIMYTRSGTTYKVVGIIKGGTTSQMALEDPSLPHDCYATKAAFLPWGVTVIS